MNRPDHAGYEWEFLDSTPSTQSVAAELLLHGAPVGVVYTENQTSGRGRFGRQWISQPGDSLTFSLVMREFANHSAPYLVGMSIAITVAEVLDCQLQWPNDLVLDGRKIGGILTELLPDVRGQRVPVVGIGINLNQPAMPPEIQDRATSLYLMRGGRQEPRQVAERILAALIDSAEPTSWASLRPRWEARDATPGKRYVVTSGQVGRALGVTERGELRYELDGTEHIAVAADALFKVP